MRKYIPLTLPFLILVAAIYFSAVTSLVADWWDDPNFSHGFFIPVLSGYLAWQKREILSRAGKGGSWAGLPVVLLAAFCYYFGAVGSMEFATRLSLILWINGTVIFLFGLPAWRILMFPLLYLAFMIPLPYLLYDMIAFPLRLLATDVATSMLRLVDIPVFREGNIIYLSTMTLAVADACSGIRSLSSLLAVACLIAYLGNRLFPARAVVVASAFPIAVLTNSFRIFATGVFGGLGYPQVADGFFHAFSGFLVFTIGLVLVLAVSRTAARIEFARPGAL